MVFSSTVFIFFFLPITLLCYRIARQFKNVQVQNYVLLLASLVFYSWGGVAYLILLLLMIVINYLCGLWIDKAKAKRLALFVGIAANLTVLFVFKYLNLVLQTVDGIAGSLGHAPFFSGVPVIPLPIGISFFTFQIMSYLIDLYRGEVKVNKKISNLALYVMMFPQLIAGPIVRYIDIEQEMTSRTITPEMERRGVIRFIIGFSKKILLANTMGAFADMAFNTTGELCFVWAWLGIVAYALQIFFDFSAYSDMAIGLGLMFGFHFNENFNYPYISRSLQEFWRRWHISLSTWFRDYVYIPLGGNRRGKVRTYINLIIVFVLTGFWHGAAWQFMFWGAFHGLFMIIERVGFSKVLKKLPGWVGLVYTLFVVLIGWVFFRADNFQAAILYLKNMFAFRLDGLFNIDIINACSGKFLAALVASVILCVPIPPMVRFWEKKWVPGIVCALLFILSIAFMIGDKYNPFIYFKF